MTASPPGASTAPDAPRSVGDVLGRIDDALENVAHVLALGPGGETIGSSGLDAPPVVALARSIAAALAAAGPEIPGDSARCVLNTSEACVFVYQLGKDLSVILVGPSDWNIALTGRRTEQLLVEFVDAYLEEIAARTPGKDVVELPRRDGGPEQGMPGSAMESRRDRRSRTSSPSGDYVLLTRVLKALVEL